MAALHLIAQSPDQGSAFRNCLRAAAPGDTVLLIGNGVYCGTDSRIAPRGRATSITWCALSADVAARAIGAQLREHVKQIDDDAFVALVASHLPIVSWS